jgi:hypothetical protein
MESGSQMAGLHIRRERNEYIVLDLKDAFVEALKAGSLPDDINTELLIKVDRFGNDKENPDVHLTFLGDKRVFDIDRLEETTRD